jgi:hypothetical protein
MSRTKFLKHVHICRMHIANFFLYDNDLLGAHILSLELIKVRSYMNYILSSLDIAFLFFDFHEVLTYSHECPFNP